MSIEKSEPMIWSTRRNNVCRTCTVCLSESMNAANYAFVWNYSYCATHEQRKAVSAFRTTSLQAAVSERSRSGFLIVKLIHFLRKIVKRHQNKGPVWDLMARWIRSALPGTQYEQQSRVEKWNSGKPTTMCVPKKQADRRSEKDRYREHRDHRQEEEEW